MKQTLFALVDCNNFYASCERMFRPDLIGWPIVVLSNNDGCVVARSAEAKKLGIKMGVPVFEIAQLLRQHNVVVFSSNYALYADLSNRVMTTLEQMAPRVEVYSIDEAFLDLSCMDKCTDINTLATDIRQRIHQWVGITVCVGIAPTKTLAKLANHAAKIYPATKGIVDLRDRERQRRLMALTPVDEVWGIGRRLSKRLQTMGVNTALQLADAHPKLIHDTFSITVERTVRELNGIACADLQPEAATKQQIISSRSFGGRIYSLADMQQAINEYTFRACEKLRLERQYAKVMSVFIRTSPFSDVTPQYSKSLTGSLVRPSNDTRDFIALGQALLQRIWKDGHAYAKAGVMLGDFFDPGVYQLGLFDEVTPRPKSKELMQLMDKVNHSGKGKIWFAGQGVDPTWGMKREQLSPSYTTQWAQLPVVK
ncbi:translesion error-prone DNA polymerase V subunit UmuC [Shewanella baltica]|uniref:translesion error-prone DNA polymerase V subunit UmuC n=1 Tax=Shewanella baltica TaxID=62322 RepID=UPI002877366F|nr:translesion error-prone DNA polymerase V subunit UmuC [Shewanella baltica]MCS6134000.1 translesion error-prone DNA polymerase V subunit UmuC [Shewanella baltica]